MDELPMILRDLDVDAIAARIRDPFMNLDDLEN